MAMDCTLGDSGQTKGKPVGRCRGWCSPGWAHQGGFSRLGQTKARLPWCSFGGSLVPRGKVDSVTLLQARIFVSFCFSLLKSPGILRYKNVFEHCTQQLKPAFTGILVNLNKQTSNTGPALWFYTGNNLTVDFSPFLPQSCWIQEKQC